MAPGEIPAAAAPAPVIPDDPDDDSLEVAPGVLARLAARSAPLPAARVAEALALAQRLPGLN